MSLLAKKSCMRLSSFLLLGAVSILIATPLDAEARGGRGGGVSSGGFSRSSPASGGSLSAPAVTNRSAVTRRQGNGGDVGTPRAVRSTGDVGQPRSAQSAGGVDTTQGVGSSGTRPHDAVTAAEMAKYKEQFRQQNDGVQSIDWDARRNPVDPEYSVPVSGTGEAAGDIDQRVPGASLVVGAPAARAVAIERADDYVDYVNTVDDPSYLAEDACSLKAMTAVNDVTYYRCSDAWYKRGYQSGNVVYIPTDPPVGY